MLPATVRLLCSGLLLALARHSRGNAATLRFAVVTRDGTHLGHGGQSAARAPTCNETLH